MIEAFRKYVNLDSYSESTGYVGYVDLTDCSPKKHSGELAGISVVLAQNATAGKFISSLYMDEGIDRDPSLGGLSQDEYQEIVKPLILNAIVRLANYDVWSDDDSELLDFNVFDYSMGGGVGSDVIYRLLCLFFGYDSYLLYGHAFFIYKHYACYLSDEGIGCVSFDSNGLTEAIGLLSRLSEICGRPIQTSIAPME